jgi:penicillin-binding protein 1A
VASLINDAPVVFEDAALEATWRPENITGRFFGPTRLREAMVHSRNLVSVRLLREMGVSPAVRHISDFGFRADSLPRDLSLSLGSGTLTPLELTRGYAVFANGGYLVEPYLIERIEDRNRETVYAARPRIVCRDCELQPEHDVLPEGMNAELGIESYERSLPSLFDDELEAERPPLLAERVIDEQNAWMITDMLRDVMRRGTGRAASQQLRRADLAGKTGTANEYRDAWFSGYNGCLVATAWIGFDQSQPLGRGEAGARAALPIWSDFMEQALRGTPETVLEQPPGLVSVRISPETGLQVGADDPGAIFEVFREDLVPERAERSRLARVFGWRRICFAAMSRS